MGALTFPKKTNWSANFAPKILKIKMKYHTTVTLTGTDQQDYIMSGNSVFDPDVTNTGAQPTNYDDIQNMYNEYVVIGSKITCVYRNQGSQTVRCALIPNFASTAFNPISYDPYGQPDAKVKTVGGYSGGHDGTIIKMYRSTANMFGRPCLYDPNFAGTNSSSTPVSRWYWHIVCWDNTANGIALNMDIDVYMTYYVIFRKVATNDAQD